jgi:RNA polymerase sigma-70 factor (ECF subfamily)
MLNFHNQDSEDLISEVFIKAHLNLASYNSKYKFSSWLYHIAHNEAINFLKKKTALLEY